MAGDHDVQLLVAAGAGASLVVLLDQLHAGVGGERVRAECADAELAPDEPVADPAGGHRRDVLDVFDARRLGHLAIMAA